MTYTYVKNYTPTDFTGSNLFKSIKVGNMELPQRIAMAPLTRMRADDSQVPNLDNMAEEYYDQRSQRPGTLIITEATFISPEASGYPNAPGIWNDAQATQWKRIFERIHKNNSFVYVQLWNLGRQASPAYLKSQNLKYVGATDDLYMDESSKKEALDSGNELKGLTKEEIKAMIQDYVKAAKLAIENGADGVEIHSANGYLLNQFMDPISNQRKDEYGSSIENRSRFTLEVVDAVVAAIGADKVGIRLSPFGQFGAMSGGDNPLIVAQFSHVLGELEKRAQENTKNRLAYVHLVEPRVTDPFAAEGEKEYLDATNDFVYSIWKGVVMRAGNYVLDNKTALKDVNENDRTLLALGRFFISNPDLIDRIEKKLPVTAYVRETFYAKGPVGYTDYSNYSA